MKFFITLTASTMLMFNNLSAQTLDTISIGAGYTQQVWYKLETDVETKKSNLDWDLAFSTRIQRDAAINTNPFATLYKAIAPAADWANVSIDTLKLVAQNGLDTTWSVGTFNMTGNNVFDYGWGGYNFVTHHVNGDSIYVLKTVAGAWKKIIIDRLSYDTTYTFRYADLNGANEVSASLNKNAFAGKNFGYYSITTNSKIDREPLIKDWDFVAGRYYGQIPDPSTGAIVSYPLTGILHNDGIKVAKVVKRDTSSDAYENLNYNPRINVIGYDWKIFDMATNQWKVADSTAYFVRTPIGKIYKIVFTKFGGSSNGNVIFTREALKTTSVRDVKNGTAALAIYPNPASDGNITLVYDLGKNAQSVDIQLFNIAGQSVYAHKQADVIARDEATEGLEQLTLPTLNLNAGIYFAQIRWNGRVMTEKVVVR